MLIMKPPQIAGYLLAGLLPFLSACEETLEGGGFTNLAAVDTASVVPSVAPGAGEFANGQSTNPGENSTEETPGGPSGSGQAVFLRRGLEDLLGFNKLSWAFTGSTDPTLSEQFFFERSNIVIDSDGDPHILQAFSRTSGIAIYYIEEGNGEYGVHVLARVFDDGGFLVMAFAAEGDVKTPSIGIFEYCAATEDSELCIQEILTAPDGAMSHQQSNTQIAYTAEEVAAGVATDPVEINAWMHVGNDNQTKAQGSASHRSTLKSPALAKALNSAKQMYLSR